MIQLHHTQTNEEVKMKKYSLRWWFEFGRQNNLATRCHAKRKLAKLAFKLGQIAA